MDSYGVDSAILFDDLDESFGFIPVASDSSQLLDDLESIIGVYPAEPNDANISPTKPLCTPRDDLEDVLISESEEDLVDDLNEAIVDDVLCKYFGSIIDEEADSKSTDVSNITSTEQPQLPLIDPIPNSDPAPICVDRASKPFSRHTILSRINSLLSTIELHRAKGSYPEFLVPTRITWSRAQFSSRDGVLHCLEGATSVSSVREDSGAKRFQLTVLLLEKMKQLLQTDTYSTKRDLYYQNVSLFGSQRVLDTILDDVTRLLKIPRHLSHVRATSKGLIAGNLVFRLDDVIVDCSAAKTGILVPVAPESVEIVSCSAQYILVIEKDATFQKLLDSRLFDKLPPGILLTGKGFPDINTRMMLQRLVRVTSLPAFALVDADPHGLEIFCVYKYGSLNMAYEAEVLTCPELEMLGVFPTDIAKLGIPDNALVAMTTADYAKARCLLARPYITPGSNLHQQVWAIQNSTHKAEIQSLCGLGASYLIDNYLPERLAVAIFNNSRSGTRGNSCGAAR